jgi:cell division protein FtsQ
VSAAAEVLSLPRAARRPARSRSSQRGRWLPSARSTLIGLVLLVAAAGVYTLARETSAFSLRSVEVQGARPAVADRVREALRSMLGTSLVSFDTGQAERRVLALPEVAAVTIDRDFPHTLRVTVSLERSVAVLRQGTKAWVVSARGRVLQALASRPYPSLPRIWVPPSVDVAIGATLGGDAAIAVRAAAPLAGLRFPGKVVAVDAGDGALTLVLASGTKVVLGDAGDLRLKLAVASKILALSQGAPYVDVSVPQRPVAGFNSQVGG